MQSWTQRQGATGRVDDWRDPFGRDRARIIHSGYFRRLQGKTQVLGLGESDFYRTRLTHSIEVAQIASGIVEALRGGGHADAAADLLPSAPLIEAVALAHDVGHPPFGHGGETALNFCMRGHGGFEGNAQTLRIATRLGEYSDTHGLDLTRRTLLGLIKYPVLHSEVVNPTQYAGAEAPANLDAFKPPKCIYDCDRPALAFALETLPEMHHEPFCSAQPVAGRHARSRYKSLDTSIMELADDIAYGVHDLEDAIALGMVSRGDWWEEVHGALETGGAGTLGEEIGVLSRELFDGSSLSRKRAIGFLVGYFIRACRLQPQGRFEDPVFDLQAVMQAQAAAELKRLKDFVVAHVIKSAEVQQLEYKGQQMVVRLFDALQANPHRLLPTKQQAEYRAQGMRAICDYLAGMTDDYATRLYHKLFTPSSGSVFDKL